MALTWQHTVTRQPVYVSLHGGTLTLNLAGEVNLTFDGEGRLVAAWMNHTRYRRALDNRVLAKAQDPGRPWRRTFRFLPPEERDRALERAYTLAAGVHDDLMHGHLDVGDTSPDTLDAIRAWLQRVRAWTLPRLAAEADRFYRIYKPIPILPPDQYLSVVLQATEGCSYNRCTFCTFYRDRPFRIKRPQEFETHIQDVKRFLGRGLLMRRTVFLADANAIIVPQHLLLPMLDAVNRDFPVLPLDAPPAQQRAWKKAHPWHVDGIYAFVSAPDALHKTVDDFVAMRERNLHRVYVGLETGHDPLRAFLLKPGTAADVVHAVETIKKGGVQVGVIFMVGVGGDRYREPHFVDTVATIRRMPLGAGDIVYISPFVASPDAPYVHDARRAGIRPLSDEDIWHEVQRFRRALLPWGKPRGVKISYYDIREFIY